MDLFTFTDKSHFYHSDLEDRNILVGSFQNYPGFQKIPSFSSLDGPKGDYPYIFTPFIGSIINGSSKENLDENFYIYKDFMTKDDNSCDEFIHHELFNDLPSIDSNNFLSDSFCQNVEIIINSNDSSTKTDEKIFPNSSLIFDKGKFDEYSWQKINEALNRKESIEEKNNENEINPKKRRKISKKRKKINRKRKYDLDNIRKKLKSGFLKSLRKVLNKKLKKAKSRYLLKPFPQVFVCNINKEPNKIYFNMTLRNLYMKNFIYSKKDKSSKANLKNYKHNKFVFKYLEKNFEISQNSNFNVIQNMKLSEIYREYIASKEFGMEISSLKQQKELDKYIRKFIIIAFNFINFVFRI